MAIDAGSLAAAPSQPCRRLPLLRCLCATECHSPVLHGITIGDSEDIAVEERAVFHPRRAMHWRRSRLVQCAHVLDRARRLIFMSLTLETMTVETASAGPQVRLHSEPVLPTHLKLAFFVMHRLWLVSRGLTVGVRGIVLDDRDRICLVRHTYLPGWHLPGGGVEAKEPALLALARELQEEAAVTIAERSAPSIHGVFLNTTHSRRDHVIVYVVRDFQRNEKRPDREIAEAGFFPIDALPDGTTKPTRARLTEVLNSTPPSSIW